MSFSVWERYLRFRSAAIDEFHIHIDNLLEEEQVKKLDNYIQHYCFSRLQHSIDVAYYSFFLSKLFGWDAKSTARAGLLHDLFLYDCHCEDYTGKWHLSRHPLIALENARKICELNKIEEDIIKKHMWLITLVPPRYKEGYIVTFVDKYCALRELVIGIKNRRNRSQLVVKRTYERHEKETVAA